MKFHLPQFQPGDRVKAKVAEIQNNGFMIVEFQGDLIRVQNQTQRCFQAGQDIALVVTRIQPYTFRLAEGQGRFDISI